MIQFDSFDMTLCCQTETLFSVDSMTRQYHTVSSCAAHFLLTEDKDLLETPNKDNK